MIRHSSALPRVSSRTVLCAASVILAAGMLATLVALAASSLARADEQASSSTSAISVDAEAEAPDADSLPESAPVPDAESESASQTPGESLPDIANEPEERPDKTPASQSTPESSTDNSLEKTPAAQMHQLELAPSIRAASYTITVRYHVNGGRITTATSGTTRYRQSSSIVQRSTDSGATWQNYTSAVSTQEYPNLVNVGTYGAYKNGYHIEGTRAYNTKANGTGLDINQQYSASSTENPATPTRINGGSAPTQNKTVTLYVNWLPNEHPLRIHANGGTILGTTAVHEALHTVFGSSGGSTIPLNAIDGSQRVSSIPEDGAYRYGYRFIGLFDAPSGGTMVYDELGNAADGAYWSGSGGSATWAYAGTHNAAVELYAQWESLELSHSIRFDPNGGSGTMDDVDVPMGQGIYTTLPRVAFSREGYRFVGWNTEQDGSGRFLTDGQTISALSENAGSVQMLYAQWAQEPQMHVIITHNHADGTVDTIDEYHAHGDTAVSYAINPHAGEHWSGTAKTCGYSAISSSGDGISIDLSDATVNLVRANVYYETEATSGEPASTDEPFDYENGTYDMSRLGLHTDKRANVVSNDNRAFELTLEAWNISDETAEVGMVLDASGSMAWALAHGDDDDADSAGMRRIRVPQELAERYAGQFIPAELILDSNLTDNSSMGYAGYHYYVRHPEQDEFAALGYVANISDEESRKGAASRYRYALDEDRKPFAWVDGIGSDAHTVPGWYFISSSSEWAYLGQEWNSAGTMSANPDNSVATGKIYQAITPYSGQYARYVACDTTMPSESPFHAFDFNDDLSPFGASGDFQARPAQFYVDEQGYLKAFFAANYTVANSADSPAPGTGKVGSSYVYEKSDSTQIKVEALQNAIARFARNLHAISPKSSIGMVRFSRNGLQNTPLGNEMLVLLDWTDDTRAITEAMNLEPGYNPTAGADSFTTGSKTGHYYGLTGNTDTISGLQAFADHMAGREPLDGSDKYLVVFTDGKDTSGDDAGVAAISQALKDDGYTIIAVLLKPSGKAAATAQYAQAEEFLKTKVATDPSLVYATDPNDPDSLYQTFEEIALNKLVSPLEGYTVRDYIDARFDLIDEDGTVISTPENIGRQLADADGNPMYLEYDDDRDMFYLEWRNQSIPTTTRAAAQPQTWSSRIRVKAKEDFLGGNAVLSNAWESSLNRVFKPGAEEASPTAETPAKDFPQTTCSPQTLALSAQGAEFTQFLGEFVNLDAQLRGNDPFRVDASWYWEYLSRIAEAEGRDRDYYIDALLEQRTVTLDYRYIGSGTEAQQADVIGTLTYSLEHRTGPDNAEEICDDQGAEWLLRIVYNPMDPVNRQDASDAMLDSGTHVHALRANVGGPSDERTASAPLEMNVVSGTLLLDKTVNCADALAALEDSHADDLTLAFSLTRSYEGPSGIRGWIDSPSTSGSVVHLTVSRAAVEAAIASGQKDLTLSHAFETLPIGTYTVFESTSDTAGSLIPVRVEDRFAELHPNELEKRCAVEPGIKANAGAESSWELARAYIGLTHEGVQEDPNDSQKAHLLVANGHAPDKASVLFDLEAAKEFAGGVLEGGEFSFAVALGGMDLAPRSGDPVDPAIYPPAQSAVNTSNGAIDFGRFRITGVVPGDRFSFAICEEEGSMPFVEYDKSQITAVVDIVDDGSNGVEAHITYEKRDANGVVVSHSDSPLSFSNKYVDEVTFTATGGSGAFLFYCLAIAFAASVSLFRSTRNPGLRQPAP